MKYIHRVDKLEDEDDIKDIITMIAEEVTTRHQANKVSYMFSQDIKSTLIFSDLNVIRMHYLKLLLIDK